jgi:hypothetical protein
MGSVAPNLLQHLGGVPVASAGNFAGWWGRKIWFVDFDSGTTGAYGNDMLKPQKNLKTILDHSDFGPGDGVFIKPRTPDTTGGDPNAITPAAAANWSIAYADHNVHLIGTGVGGYMTRLQGHASVTASPTLTVNAPFVVLENLGFRRGGSTSGIVKFVTNASTGYSFGSIMNYCHLRLADSAGGVIIESAWYTKILNTEFSSCNRGLVIGASNSVPVEIVVDWCKWISAVGDVTADIFASGAVTRISISNFIMNHAVPSGGSPNRYVSIGATSTGTIVNGSTGAVDPTIADNMTLNGVLYSNIWGDGVGPFVDA